MRDRLRELVRHGDFLTLVLLALVVGGVWVFVELVDELHEGELAAFDAGVSALVRRTPEMDPRWLRELMRDASALGGVLALTLVVASTVIGLWLERRRTTATWLAVAVISALGASTLFKFWFARERPDWAAPDVLPSSFSFPSGHAFLSAAVYLTLGALLSRLAPNIHTRAFILFMALFATFLVGVSRVYLGVHYPSDVLAGWTLGLGWAALCWLIVSTWGKRLSDRSRI